MIYRIHSVLLQKASKGRRQEWQFALTDLNHEPDDDGKVMTVYRGRHKDVQLVIAIKGGEPNIIQVDAETLDPHFKAYDAIIRRIAGSSTGDEGIRSLATLDYAKKLIHDEAGEMIQEQLEDEVELELSRARQLFTLIFLIASDLPERLVTYHRIHS